MPKPTKTNCFRQQIFQLGNYVNYSHRIQKFLSRFINVSCAILWHDFKRDFHNTQKDAQQRFFFSRKYLLYSVLSDFMSIFVHLKVVHHAKLFLRISPRFKKAEQACSSFSVVPIDMTTSITVFCYDSLNQTKLKQYRSIASGTRLF